MRYAQALADWGDVGGYEAETLWDVCTVAALGTPYERAQWREVRTRCGEWLTRWEPQRLANQPDVTVDVALTRHGPIITDLIPGETRKIALRSAN